MSVMTNNHQDWTALFVYGSLMPGCHRDDILNDAIAKGLAIHKYCAQTTKNYDLLDFGTFPGMIYGNYAIGGEIYIVAPEILTVLDEYEGYPRLYTREMITLYTDDVYDAEITNTSKLEEAQAYMFNYDDDGKLLLNVLSNDHPDRVSGIKQITKSLKIWWE